LFRWLAAPAGDSEWASRWHGDVAQARRRFGDLLDGLRLWRLSDSGALLDEVLA